MTRLPIFVTWPKDTDDLRYFYPTGALVTAREIIFLWVARMIMFGLEFRGDVPFRDVYINPTVLNNFSLGLEDVRA